jgi:hypothetical protein
MGWIAVWREDLYHKRQEGRREVPFRLEEVAEEQDRTFIPPLANDHSCGHHM